MCALQNTIQIETKLEKVKYYIRLYYMIMTNVSLQERTNIVLIKDRVNKYNDLTKSMNTILNSFEQRLGKLEQTILPVYNITKNLQKTQYS